MSFKVKTFEELTTRMIEWTKGNTTSLKDFRVGSKIRTTYEAVAMVLEELYIKIWTTMKDLIEESVYIAFDFSRLPAKKATGYVLFSKQTPAQEAYVIPIGTIICTEETEQHPSLRFETTKSATLEIGETQISVPIVAQLEGSVCNVYENTIIQFVTQPVGIEFVTNLQPLINGRDIETKDARKRRFREYIASRYKATLPALEYGAKTVDGVSHAVAIDNPKVYALIWDNTTFLDVSDLANDPYETAVNLLPAIESVDNAVYLGAYNKFNFISVFMTTTGIGTGGVWEYFDGTDWVSIQSITDGTTQLTLSGVINFPIPLDWADTKVYDIWAFWVRFRITTANYTQTPQIGHIFISPPPGVVELYIQDQYANASVDLLNSVAEVTQDYKGAGISVNVKAPTKILLAIDCKIKVDTINFNKVVIRDKVQQLIIDYLLEFKLGEDFILNRLINQIMQIESGKAIYSIEIDAPSGDILVHAGEIIRPDEANIQVLVIN